MSAMPTEMHLSRRQRHLFAAALVVMLAAVWLAPATHAAEGAEASSTESGYTTLFRWLNFALVFGAAAYLIAKKAPPFFRKRAEVISGALTEAAAVKAEAESQLREAEHKLAHLDQELAELRAAAKREAAAEAERLRAATQTDQAKIARAADAEIEAAGRAAHSELRTIAAGMAIERAKSLIEQQLTPSGRAGIFRTFVGRLAGSTN
jgi:F0F1-type ATP synthase membrane subunit b/b'